MNELFDLRPTNKEIAFGILFVFVLLVGIFCAGYMLGIERASDVHDNGSGAEHVGQQVGQATTDISNAKDGISEAQHTAADIANTVEYLTGTADTSAGIIKECKQIIERVRSRGKTDAASR